MRIAGKRLLIRDITFKDDNDFFEYAKRDEVGPDAGRKPVPSMEVARRVIASYILAKDVFAIELIEEKKMIGTISIYNSTKYQVFTQLPN